MNKILLSVLTSLLILAASSASAQIHTGSWFVLADPNAHSCFAAPRTASGGEHALSGPYARQATALTAIKGIVECHGPYAHFQPGSDSL